jgi:hypothetical protein
MGGALIIDMRNAHKNLVGRPRRRCEDNIKTMLKLRVRTGFI